MTESVYRRADAVLCFENFKDAALYFDRVLPLNMGRMRGDPDVGDILVGYPEEIPSTALSHLIDGVEGDSQTFSHGSRIMDFTTGRWVEFARRAEPYVRLWAPHPQDRDEAATRLQYEKLRSAYLSNERINGHQPIRDVFQEYARSLGFERFCVAAPPVSDSNTTNVDPALTLAQLRLVDASKAEWRQIIEVRKDHRAHRNLTRLRLFLHANYAGKSFAFIEDDLSQRIAEYDAVCKKHGLKTALSSITVLLDTKDLQAALGAGLVAGIFGGPLAALSAGAAVEIGKIAVHIAERQHQLREWKSGHELAYIVDTPASLSSR